LKSGKTSKLNDLTSQFYTAIPHDFGRKVPTVLNTLEQVQEKMDLLEVLGDIVIAQNLLKSEANGDSDEVDHPLDVQFKKLRNKLKPLDHSSEEFKIISTYTKNTQGYFNLQILDIFELEREGDMERFTEHKDLGNRKLLWHGTNVAVVAAILSGGLRIMPHAGGRVGRGLYFASENVKSASYVRCADTPEGKIGIMFLNEVALGTEHHITEDDSSLTKAPKGSHSIIAKGKVEPDPTKDVTISGAFGDVVVPQGKPINMKEFSSSHFMNSEYLVYKESQVLTRYLLKLKFN